MNDIYDVTFWGMNIPKVIKRFAEMTKEENKKVMSESEFRAYELGIENTITIMKQVLDDGLNNDLLITFYNPDVNDTVEFIEDELVSKKIKMIRGENIE